MLIVGSHQGTSKSWNVCPLSRQHGFRSVFEHARGPAFVLGIISCYVRLYFSDVALPRSPPCRHCSRWLSYSRCSLVLYLCGLTMVSSLVTLLAWAHEPMGLWGPWAHVRMGPWGPCAHGPRPGLMGPMRPIGPRSPWAR